MSDEIKIEPEQAPLPENNPEIKKEEIKNETPMYQCPDCGEKSIYDDVPIFYGTFEDPQTECPKCGFPTPIYRRDKAYFLDRLKSCGLD